MMRLDVEFSPDIFAKGNNILQRITRAVLGGPDNRNNGRHHIPEWARINLDIDQIFGADSRWL
jgi:hypothetical protein